MSFKKGASDNTHTALLLVLLPSENSWYASSKTKSIRLNEIVGKPGFDLSEVTRAVDHRKRVLNSFVDLPRDFDFQSPSVVEALFQSSPRKRTVRKIEAVSSEDEDESDEYTASDAESTSVQTSPSKRNSRPASSRSTPSKSTPSKHPPSFRQPPPSPPSSPPPVLEFVKSEIKLESFPTLSSTVKSTNVDKVVTQLHPASEPITHPCREEQFDQLFINLESAISAETGTCIYVSGTPGTGKTSTIREVIGQLELRVQEGELRPFSFLEINGMKMVHPNAAYEHLWEALGRGQMAASNAMTALESAFNSNESLAERGVMVVLLDELDQLVTKGQQLMYNFFNWPSLPNSRLIVIAVANTMDLPERLLSNKISSRVGLTRVQFPGYTHEQLHEILLQRLGDASDLIEPEALDYAARKVASVGGDARRVLDFVAQAVATAQLHNDIPVRTAHVRDITLQSQTSPMNTFLSTLGYATKVLLCALVTSTRRSSNIEAPLHEILRLARQLVHSSANADVFEHYLFTEGSARLSTFKSAIMELVEGGVLLQQAIRGEATPLVRLMIPVTVIKDALAKDRMLQDMI